MFAFCSSYFYFYFSATKNLPFSPSPSFSRVNQTGKWPNVLGTKEPSCDADILLGLKLYFAVLMTCIHPK